LINKPKCKLLVINETLEDPFDGYPNNLGFITC
jgi:hypothetical protein